MNAATACPFCSCPEAKSAFPYETVWDGKKYEYEKCSSCGTTYVRPLPASGELERIYSYEKYHSFFYDEPAAKKYQISVRTLLNHSAGRKTLLDFGCGAGFFLSEAKKAGFLSSGVELDPETRKKAQELSGCRVFSVEELEKEARGFDIIHMGDVLEHLPDPFEKIKKLKAFLNPGGVFFFEGPLQNNPSLVYALACAVKNIRRFFRVDSPGTLPPTHITMTNKAAMQRFLSERMGFDIIYFRVYETGWPYLSRKKGRSSLSRYLKALLGMLAVAVSRLEFGKDKKLGNKFMAICAG